MSVSFYVNRYSTQVNKSTYQNNIETGGIINDT